MSENRTTTNSINSAVIKFSIQQFAVVIGGFTVAMFNSETDALECAKRLRSSIVRAVFPSWTSSIEG